MLQAQPVRDLLRGVLQPQTPLDLPCQRTVDLETMGLRAARTMACRTLRNDRLLAAATTVTGDLA